ncbi:MAG: zinc-binding dehydrogenase [Armatimonadota bacterium]|nr:zinc-binding dehydrogenase [Armatimonadota bacterium]MDR7401132.1 zinc-binding dehydrogenase [Armatimonadota bacterium]MDR7404332.1 zinc-binding dehydrogenase [Armatimonadota bacterium]MDR7436427.1 zinc-binding dehydrogenase [Armatimonadota bacterium]MDR7471785.1 zinc-binding dehydrogenase [Armatimonadota bacterium]
MSTPPTSTATMRACVYYQYGGPEVLVSAEVPRPVPGPGQALVRVRAAGVNAFDLMARSGRYRPNPGFPHILGADFAGEVAEVGPDAPSAVRPGQRVTAWWVVSCQQCEQCLSGHPNRCALNYRYLGAHLPGAYAEYVLVPAGNLIPLPEDLTWEEGAAIPTVFGTAWHMLVSRANVRPGEIVLVHAASAGVSTAAIQIAKLVGATVFATSSEDWKLDRARALGADVTINYATHDFQQEVMRLTNKRGVDVVVEHVGGEVWEKSIRSLTRGGRLVTTGGTAGYDVTMNIAYVFHKELTILGSNSATKRELEVMMPLFRAGRLKPVVDRVFPLEEAAAAHRYMESRAHFGKVVLRVP